MSKEKYTMVFATLLRRTPMSIRIRTAGDEELWVPRSLVHGADDPQIEDLDKGDEFSFRLMEWKAQELGL